MKIANENRINLEFGVNGTKTYKKFLSLLMDGNYHDLKQSIENQINEAIENRNKRNFATKK